MCTVYIKSVKQTLAVVSKIFVMQKFKKLNKYEQDLFLQPKSRTFFKWHNKQVLYMLGNSVKTVNYITRSFEIQTIIHIYLQET